MQPVGLFVVNVVNRQPNSVQVYRGYEVLEQRHYLHHLRRIGRHLRQLRRGFNLRRRRQVQGQRDVLRDIPCRARQPVLGHEEAHPVPFGAGVLALGKRLVDLVANPLAHRCALFQAFVIAAGIQRRGHDEDRLGADQRNGGPGRIDQRRRLLLLKSLRR